MPSRLHHRMAGVVTALWSVRRRREFALLQRAAVIRTKLLAVHVCEAIGAPDDPPRLAFAVPSGAGSAVERNAARRVVRSVMHAHADALRGRSMLVRIGVRGASAERAELRADAHALMARLLAASSVAIVAAGAP